VGSSSSIQTEPDEQQSAFLDLRHARVDARSREEQGFERRNSQRCGREEREVDPVAVEGALG